MTELFSIIEKAMPLIGQDTSSTSAKDLAADLCEESAKSTIKSNDDDDSDYGASISMKKIRKRVKRFSDSDSEEGNEITPGTQEITSNSGDSDDYTSLLNNKSKKLRIKKVDSDGSESDSQQINKKENELTSKRNMNIQNSTTEIDSDSEIPRKSSIIKNEEQQTRMKNKRDKIRDKFKGLLNSRDKDKPSIKINKDDSPNKNSSSSSNDDEETSIGIIRQKIKERASALKISSIIDPDTSEDEKHHTQQQIHKPKKQQRRVKPTSPKPQRMSAKQAMENMQKIKSESNRMLREKDVSLPYHRPKALNLKDIMSRRKLAVSADGKALPIKMNEEQLKQYAMQLEQRQKEMMELCKSDTEEEEEEPAQLEDFSNNTGLSNENCETISEVNSNICSDINAEAAALDSEVNIAVKISTNEIIEEPCTIEISRNDDEESKETHEINKTHTDDENPHDKSEELQLVYNDSIEDTNTTNSILKDNTDSKTEVNLNKKSEISESDSANTMIQPIVTVKETNDNLILNDDMSSNKKNCTETDSQYISLHYDTERIDFVAEHTGNNEISKINCTKKELETDITNISHKSCDEKEQMEDLNDVAKKNIVGKDHMENYEFPSDDDDVDMDAINIEDIDSIIENAEIVKDGVLDRKFDSPALIKDSLSLNKKPILMGAPGMVIDLDGGDATAPKKLTGVELLKERFTYFARLKTPEEMERERERRQKPGTQHIKLKQELEDLIAEQRSLEWAKRLEGENQQHNELDAVKGDPSDAEDDIDKIEARLEEDGANEVVVSSESEEDDIEDDVLIEDKPRKKNPLLADEAEESDVDELQQDNNDGGENDNDLVEDNDADSEESSDEDESSQSEDENEELKPKKSRILKAFEDSDDEETKICDMESDLNENKSYGLQSKEKEATSLIVEKYSESEKPVHETAIDKDVLSEAVRKPSDTDDEFGKRNSISESQDDDLQLAQVHKAVSDELFTSLDSVDNKSIKEKLITNNENCSDDTDLGSQTFSILKSDSTQKSKFVLDSQEKLIVISETQPFDSTDAILGMCSGSFSQNYIEFKPPSTQSQMLESQAIGEDLLDMCTGKFYDNKFVSQTDDNVADTCAELSQDSLDVSDVLDDQDVLDAPDILDAPDVLDTPNVLKSPQGEINKVEQKQQGDILKSVLDELNDPAFESSKPMKFFFDGKSQNKENEHYVNNTQLKKKFVIDSDDETNDDSGANVQKKKKKLKKRKPEKRALQISDDEDDEHSEESVDSLSETDDVNNEEKKRLVEYDSEENEVVLEQPQPKRKRKAVDFFEQEAELTSEDEWAGSGDEDEAGLDRMEREAGDDDNFHQGKLQRELGQIHIRDVLDQDKREVRIIQELLFEDGDLGVGGRQRKFRWRDAVDGDDATGALPEQLGDTQEEEFESEEQWRKQRHEREMFLRQMNTKDGAEDELSVTVNRSSIIKANLYSRTMSSLLEEVTGKSDETTPVMEKKVVKDVISPTKPFSVYQQNYHGSLLTRGRGALERLAALATPLAAAEHAARPTHSNTNFVFAAIAQDDEEPKVNKRKAETNVGTPQLVKKMRTEDKKKQFKSSLLDYMKA